MWKVLFIVGVIFFDSLSLIARTPEVTGPMQPEESVEIEMEDEELAGIELRP